MEYTYKNYMPMADKLIKDHYEGNVSFNQLVAEVVDFFDKANAIGILEKLGVGIEEISRARSSASSESGLVSKRFIWLDGPLAEKVLSPSETVAIGMFLPGGPFFGYLRNDVFGAS